MGNLTARIRYNGPLNRTGFSATFTNKITHVEISEIDYDENFGLSRSAETLAENALIDSRPPYSNWGWGREGRKKLAQHLTEQNRKLADQINENRVKIQLCRKGVAKASE